MKRGYRCGGWEAGGYIPFFSNDALTRQSQNIETSISYQTKVLRGSYSDSRVKERRVFDGVAIEALGAKLEHG